jgi:hypothetical protein
LKCTNAGAKQLKKLRKRCSSVTVVPRRCRPARDETGFLRFRFVLLSLKYCFFLALLAAESHLDFFWLPFPGLKGEIGGTQFFMHEEKARIG